MTPSATVKPETQPIQSFLLCALCGPPRLCEQSV